MSDTSVHTVSSAGARNCISKAQSRRAAHRAAARRPRRSPQHAWRAAGDLTDGLFLGPAASEEHRQAGHTLVPDRPRLSIQLSLRWPSFRRPPSQFLALLHHVASLRNENAGDSKTLRLVPVAAR